MKEFLKSSAIIDWKTPAVSSKAREIANGSTDDELVAKQCFLWVRDHVRHSRDYRIPIVTCSASEVLKHRAGYCYAKAHLLAALLRACEIPAALCYQRLQVSETDLRFTLHGLNAVYLRNHGWYRMDARGNKSEVEAKFDPPNERLAFPLTVPGERDLPGRFAEPLPEIVELLARCKTEDEVFRHLPDFTSPDSDKQTTRLDSPASNSPIKLRPATLSDQDILYAMHVELFREHIDEIWGWNNDWQIENFKKEWAEVQTELILQGDRLCGYIQIRHKPDHLYVLNLALYSEFQNQGIGSKAMESVKQRARSKGLEIRLSVFKTNQRVIQFYTRLGFEIEAKTETGLQMLWLDDSPTEI